MKNSKKHPESFRNQFERVFYDISLKFGTWSLFFGIWCLSIIFITKLLVKRLAAAQFFILQISKMSII